MAITPTRAAPHGAPEARPLPDSAARAAGLGLCTLQRHGRRWRVSWNAQMHALQAWPQGHRPPRTLAAWLRSGVHRDDCLHVRSQLRRWLRHTDAPLTLDFRAPAGAALAARWLSLHVEATSPRDLLVVLREQAGAHTGAAVQSQMLARISHELRTPLHAILGVTQLMLMADMPPDPVRRRHQLEQVQGASLHLLALIDGALDLSTPEAGALRQPVDLPAVVAQAVGLLQTSAAAQGVRLQVGAQTALPPAGDATRLRQALVHLLTNGIQYNRHGGTVTVSTRAVPAAAGSAGLLQPGHVVLCVADDGPGMSAEQQAQLFQPFNRLGREQRDSPGTGTGLAIVKALADSMGGWVQVHSRPGHGSVFEVWLQQAMPPVSQAATPPAPLATPAPPGLPPSASGRRRPLPRLADDGQGRVLYVEDNPVNAMIVQASVAHRPGIELQVAEDGASGIQLAHTMQPHLVLLDMQLPDTDGHGVLKALRADPRTAHLPCIALSANVLPEDIREALAAGFIDYWTKPIELPALLGALDALFGAPGESRPA